MLNTLLITNHLDLIGQMSCNPAIGGIAKGNIVREVEMDFGENIFSNSVIIATGTVIDGIIHIGLNSYSAGRAGEPPTPFLARNSNELGITSGRQKTGTSPRIDARTIQFNELTGQPGDRDHWPFSYSTTEPLNNKAVCWIGRTNTATHQIIKDNLEISPLYTGKIKNIGPIYCLSIEDKIIRFGERNAHTLFLEPESIENQELYLNGLSASLPLDVQIKLVKQEAEIEKIPGKFNYDSEKGS